MANHTYLIAADYVRAHIEARKAELTTAYEAALSQARADLRHTILGTEDLPLEIRSLLASEITITEREGDRYPAITISEQARSILFACRSAEIAFRPNGLDTYYHLASSLALYGDLSGASDSTAQHSAYRAWGAMHGYQRAVESIAL